jgi:hypothetical protein
LIFINLIQQPFFFILADVESAPAGSRLLGAGDEGIQLREIAAVIGRQLNVPVVSITPEEADAHFGFLGAIRTLFCLKKQGCPRSL